jgi:hypothetical protein
MDLTITVAEGSARRLALTRAMDAYNARNPPITEQNLLQKLVDGQLDSLVASYVTTTLSKLDFLNRFTVDERVAIRTAAQSNAQVADYLGLLDAAQTVDLTDARTTAGVQALEAAGLIAQGRAAQILAL